MGKEGRLCSGVSGGLHCCSSMQCLRPAMNGYTDVHHRTMPPRPSFFEPKPSNISQHPPPSKHRLSWTPLALACNQAGKASLSVVCYSIVHTTKRAHRASGQCLGGAVRWRRPTCQRCLRESSAQRCVAQPVWHEPNEAFNLGNSLQSDYPSFPPAAGANPWHPHPPHSI